MFKYLSFLLCACAFSWANAQTLPNVLYAGYDHSIDLASAENSKLKLTAADFEVSLTNGKATHTKGLVYKLQVTQIGETNLVIKNKKNGKVIADAKLPVKRIPDPVVKLAGKTDGTMSTGEMRAQRNILVVLENFELDAKCEVRSFTLYHTSKGQEPVELKSESGRFAGAVLQAIKNAKVGDEYQFVDIRASCIGDAAGRALNALAFKIK